MPVTASTHLGFSTYKKRAFSIVVEPCKYPVRRPLVNKLTHDTWLGITSIKIYLFVSGTEPRSETANSLNWKLQCKRGHIMCENKEIILIQLDMVLVVTIWRFGWLTVSILFAGASKKS
jgi:hypothetical protein